MLAFDPAQTGQEIVIDRLGILTGSLLSALVGYAVLSAVLPKGRAQGA
jgi:Na+/H+ antiporter NhaA